MIIMGVDPGNEYTAFCFYKYPGDKHHGSRILGKGKELNHNVLRFIEKNKNLIRCIYVEDIANYGMVSGKSVYDTCKYIGRIIQLASMLNIPIKLAYRKTIVTHHTDNPKANDKIIRQFLIDTIGEQGTKKNPGPLYGFAADMFSALAIAMYGSDMEMKHDKESNSSQLPKP